MGGSLEDTAGKSGLGLHWKILIGMAIGALTGIACNLFVQGQGPEAVAKLKSSSGLPIRSHIRSGISFCD